MRNVLPFAVTMFAYAAALLFMGVLTYLARPPELVGARALTSILIPGVGAAITVVCAFLVLRAKRSIRNAKIGVYLGLILALLMVLGPGLRISSSLKKNQLFYQAEPLVDQGSEVTKVPVHPTGYQAVGLGGVAALSFFAFIAMAGQRPRFDGVRSKPKSTHQSAAKPVDPSPPPPAPDPEPIGLDDSSPAERGDQVSDD